MGDAVQNVWSGTLATGGRVAEEISVDIVLDAGGEPHILRRDGLQVIEVHLAQIRPESLLKALVELTQKSGRPTPPDAA